MYYRLVRKQGFGYDEREYNVTSAGDRLWDCLSNQEKKIKEKCTKTRG